MTAKEYLQQLHRADVIIDQRIQEKADLRERLSSIGSFDYARDRVQTSTPGDAPYVGLIEKIIDIEDEIDRLIDGYVDLKHKMISEIHGLQDSRYIEILYKKYVEGKRLEEIAVEMDYTFQYVVLLHGHALKEFSKKHSIYFQC